MTMWDVSINGTPLNTGGTGVTGVSGVGAIAGRDYYNQQTFASDGESSNIGGLAAGVFGIDVLVWGWDRGTGLLPEGSTGQAEAQANLEWLTGLFMTDYLLNVELTLPPRADESELQRTRYCQAQLKTMSSPAWDESRSYCKVTLGFVIPDVYWRASGGIGGLDANGYKTISMGAGVTTCTLPTDIHQMNGFIEDAFITIQNAANPIKTVQLKALNRGAGTAVPTMQFTTTRTNGVIYANAKLEVDCKKHTAIHTSGGVAESVMKYDASFGGRPGSLLRIGPPYSLQLVLTPYTAGASMTGVTWSIKYRPAFI